MAHFVKMNGNRCGNIIVVNNEVLKDNKGIEQESLGIAFCKSLYGEDTEWLQTSYNGTFRGRYASGCIYDSTIDEFVIPEQTSE